MLRAAATVANGSALPDALSRSGAHAHAGGAARSGRFAAARSSSLQSPLSLGRGVALADVIAPTATSEEAVAAEPAKAKMEVVEEDTRLKIQKEAAANAKTEGKGVALAVATAAVVAAEEALLKAKIEKEDAVVAAVADEAEAPGAADTEYAEFVPVKMRSACTIS